MIKTQPETDTLLTVREVAQRLRLKNCITVQRWINAGTLDAVALPHAGNRIIYRVKASTLAAIVGEEK